MLPTLSKSARRNGTNRRRGGRKEDDGGGNDAFLDEEDEDGFPSPRGAGMGPVFRTIEVAAEDKRPAYMPYDKLSFPSVTREAKGDPVAELDKLWMVGFVHHETATGPTGASADLVKEYEKRFGVRQGGAAAARSKEARMAEAKKVEEGDKAFTKEERKRIEELEARFRKEEREKRKGPPPKTLEEKRKHKLKTSAYAVENRKIRKTLQLRGKEGKRLLSLYGSSSAAATGTAVRSSGLENVIFLDRVEQRAAVVVQRAFRRFLRMLFWRKWLIANRAATTIQRAARGYIIRRLVREWVSQREKLVTKCQALVRGKLTRDAAYRMQLYEDAAATDIQRVVRGFLFRCRAKSAHRRRAATKIQALWRGCLARARADRLFLEGQVVKIQASVRAFLKRRFFMGEVENASIAAGRLQAAFRGFRARVLRNQALWERETGNRKSWMRILRAEERWLDKEIAKRVKRRARENLELQLDRLHVEWRKNCDEVAAFEFDLINLHMERQKLSPRAIQQGWAGQLQTDAEKHRLWVTESKAKALFDVALNLRSIKAHKDEDDERLEDLLAKKKEVETRWADERVLLIRRQNERDWAERRVEQAKTAAAERRKWAVEYYTESGKPDLRRQAGVNLDPDMFPHGQNRTLTIAHGDLTALARPLPLLVGQDDERQMRLEMEYRARTGFMGGAPGQLLPSRVDASGTARDYLVNEPDHDTTLVSVGDRSRPGQRLLTDDGARGDTTSKYLEGGERGDTASKYGERGDTASKYEGGSPRKEEDDGLRGPETVFAEDIARAKKGTGPLPTFLASGLHSGETGSQLRRFETEVQGRVNAGEHLHGREIPAGLVGARRGEAAAAIAAARVTGTVGTTGVAGRREERRREMAKELDQFRRLGDRVQALADKAAAVTGWAETVQYGALAKPLFDNMHKLMDRLRADPQAAAEALAIHPTTTSSSSSSPRKPPKRSIPSKPAPSTSSAPKKTSLAVGFDLGRDDGTGKPITATVVRRPVRDPVREARKRARHRAARTTIPWSLLDELEAEKDALRVEERKKPRYKVGKDAERAKGAGLTTLTHDLVLDRG